ncbi:MAG TPA: alpha/beta hydrolase [Acidimicrobiales bacterium]|nr:alpha/beta hydrolase [Acidimicrobiales bacterium]
MFLPAGGHILNVVQMGGGDRTLVAHGGWVGSWELWQEPFQLLQDGWRCIGYDHRGSGASTAPPDAISPEALVDDLFTVLDALGVERCVLAGESLGALTCALAVLRDPSRFEGLVIVDGAPAASREAMAPLIDGPRTDWPGTVQWFIDACVPEPDSEHIRRWGRQILLRADAEAAARVMECHAEANVFPDWSSISVKTLVLHGELDVIVPLSAAEMVAGAVPDAELVVLPGAGHVPTMTRPAAVVAEIERVWH